MRLHTDTRDVMPGMDVAARIDTLYRISYTEFLEKYWNLDPAVVRLFNFRPIDLFALPGRLLPAL